MHGLFPYSRWKKATSKGKWLGKYSSPMEHLGYNYFYTLGVHRGTQGALERLEAQGFGDISKHAGLFMFFPFHWINEM